MSDVMVEVDEFILVCAVRYALGRRSYAPQMVADEVRRNIPVLSPGMKKVLIESIDSEPDLGDTYDVITWLDLRKDLEE